MPRYFTIFSWGISIALHGILIFLTLPTSTHIEKKTQPTEPIQIELIEKKRAPSVKSKTLITPHGIPSTHKKPTALPGDRRQPAVSKKASPIYPKKALNNDWEGTVKVNVTVSKWGKPTSIRIVSSSGHAILDNAFVRSIKQTYEFKPKRKMGKDESGTLVLSYTFSIKDIQ
jgi:TonB family protein